MKKIKKVKKIVDKDFLAQVEQGTYFVVMRCDGQPCELKMIEK